MFSSSTVHQTSSTTRRPGSSRPHLQKKPHSKPHSDQEYQGTGSVSQITRRPQNGRPEEDRHHNGGHHHHHHYKDKVSSSQHNTLLVRQPNNKNGQSSKNQRPSHHHRPRPQNDEEKSDDMMVQDMSVQETIHRPSINSVDDDVRNRLILLREDESELTGVLLSRIYFN